jgi:hypothetical protein
MAYTTQDLLKQAFASFLTPEEARIAANPSGNNPQNGGTLGFRPEDLMTTGHSEIEWL